MLLRRYHSLLLDRGAYFQEIHWDVSWRKHTGSPGFQLWYLVEQPPPRLGGTGNMFMVDSPDDMKPDDHPWKYHTERSKVAKLEHFTQQQRFPRDGGCARVQCCLGRELGASHLALHVDADNTPAIGLYERSVAPSSKKCV